MAYNPRPDPDSMTNIRLAERRGDFAHTLSRVDWDLFITLTFKNPLPRLHIRYGMAFRFVQDVSKITAVPYKNILLALRAEQGEKSGRPHLHALIGGTNTRNAITLSNQLERAWRIISGNSIPDVRPYVRSLAGAEYVCKCLGANAYEQDKYSLAEQVTLSHSVLSVIRAMDAKGDRRRDEYTRKNGQVMNAAGLKTGIRLGSPGLPAVSNLYDETASVKTGMVGAVPA